MQNYMDGGEAIVEALVGSIDYVPASPETQWGSVWEALSAARQGK